jgi:DNA-binding NarL/FixJ family response regulator
MCPHRLPAQAAREEAETLLRSAETVYERLQIPTQLQAVQALRSSSGLEAQRKRHNTLAERHTWQGLTQRERQVLLQLSTGRTNQEIAAVLGTSVSTVERHVTHILTKLGCKTRTQAATYAVAQGWLTALR